MKRVFDIVVSFFGLVVILPVFFIIAIAVIVESRGGVFYLQKRVGKNNKDFKIFKFRTMYTNSDKKGLLTVGSDDKRITKIGLILRKYKLDELPQLINVLIGNMSLVGPRPEVRKYVNLYTNEQKKVLGVKPGITDPASLKYSNENEILAQFDDPEKVYIEEIMQAKLNINLEYIKTRSLKSDFKVIIDTLKKIKRH
ncbi:MAG: sugar transferase [Bacteroidales bacterium]|nr:sugar transferase [Bacteroidales bacterium]MDD4236140.1 sugar transferase [Bacteroidales bacterium]MDY0159998.1 sugar transferase [Bacteroidales bacterium]